MQTLAVARGSDESVYQDLTGVGPCCILDPLFDQRFVAVLCGTFQQGLSCEHIVMHTIMDRTATTHVKLMLAVCLFVTTIACEVGVTRSARSLFIALPRGFCLLVTFLGFFGLQRRRGCVSPLRERPITNGLGCCSSFVRVFLRARHSRGDCAIQ